MIKEIKVLKKDWTTRCGEIKQMCKNPEFSAGCVYTVGNPRGQLRQLRVKPLGFSIRLRWVTLREVQKFSES